ncbi:4-hydroxy-3-methylbut-2-enyl diphosphate reductase [Candidatus Gracilibacteria bacterium]|nr:4-hydroxy-3-methylbut-2-enyl diphosphate reductase [Candidatus Gracilibacteria bacterium]
MFNILLASPRGYCAGVDRAIGMLDDIVKEYSGEGPIYVNHEIVHNKFIVNYFERKGVIFSDDLDSIPTNSIMVFSAHGVAPSFVKRARELGLRTIDASCPLVIKVHNEAKKFIRDGYKIIYIGKKSHQEAIGVRDNDLENITVVGNKDEVDDLSYSEGQKLAVLNQTTLSVDDTKDVISYVQEKFPQVKLPGFSDICYATTNRQEAVKELVNQVDALIIVGSKNSSNSTKLALIGERKNIPSILIDTPEEIPETFFEHIQSIGISSGASVPDSLVQNVIQFLEKKGGTFVKEIITKEEKMVFPYKIQLD